MKKLLRIADPKALQATVVEWFRERIDLGPVVAFAAKKTVPMHRHAWIYTLGGAALFLLGLQVASGVLLMLYYQPGEASAHESVLKIMTEVPSGGPVRSMHVWGANFFVAVVVAHFLVKLFTRAYRRPRELTWISGMVLLFLALGFGFSGYLLPWNELSFFATKVGTNIPATIPVVGDWVEHLLRGGAYVTDDTLTRFFAGHVMLLPLTLAPFLAMHLGLIQAQGMSLPLGLSKEKTKGERPFLSEFLLIDGCVWLLAFGLIVTLATLVPAEVGIKADPLEPTPEGIKPEWYFLFMFQTLKHVPETVGVLFFALVALFLLLVPFLDRKAMREEKCPGFTAVFVILAVYATVFEVWAMAGSLSPLALMRMVSEFLIFCRGQLLLALGSPESAGSLFTLALMWIVIGFLVFYLRQLLRENTRIRELYR